MYVVKAAGWRSEIVRDGHFRSGRARYVWRVYAPNGKIVREHDAVEAFSPQGVSTFMVGVRPRPHTYDVPSPEHVV